jgi:hypothetical protein
MLKNYLYEIWTYVYSFFSLGIMAGVIVTEFLLPSKVPSFVFVSVQRLTPSLLVLIF